MPYAKNTPKTRVRARSANGSTDPGRSGSDVSTDAEPGFIGASDGDVLAVTGSALRPLLFATGGLLAVGAAVMIATVRRRRAS
jgi:hypothetical protein